MATFIHQTAEVSEQSKIGKNTKIWNFSQIRENVEIGDNCIIGKNVYIDAEVKIGNNVKIQNNCSLYRGLTVENGVFIGPHVIFTNDKHPRAINPDGSLKDNSDWECGEILVAEGASISAGAIILPDIKIGRFAMVGAGSVVTKDIPDYGLVYGNPAKLVGRVSMSGKRVDKL